MKWRFRFVLPMSNFDSMATYEIGDATRDGVFGPEVWVNPDTGSCYLKHEDGSFLGNWHVDATLNAFFVYVGVVVIVVAEGVRESAIIRVADGLREFLGRPDLSVVFSRGKAQEVDRLIMASLGEAEVSEDSLAKAEAFVMVQCELREEDKISIELNGVVRHFSVDFSHVSGRNYVPIIV